MTTNRSATAVQRRLPLDRALSADQRRWLEAGLATLEGMLEVRVRGRTLLFRYEPAQVDFRTLHDEIITLGLRPASGMVARWRAGFYQYLDDNARRLAGAPPADCCGNPARVHARYRRG